MTRAPLLLLFWVFACCAQSELDGVWVGTIGEGENATKVVCGFDKTHTAIVSFTTSSENTIDSVTVNAGRVHFEVKWIHAIFEGRLDPGGRKIHGTWTQPGRSLPMQLERTDKHTLNVAEYDGIDAFVPKPPTVFRSAGKDWVYYEVHITNWTDAEMTLVRVEMLIGDEAVPIEGETLKALVRPAGLTIAPMARCVVLARAAGDSFPGSIRHRVTVQLADNPRPHTIECAPTPVLEGAIRIAPPLMGGEWLANNGPQDASHHRGEISAMQGRATISQRFAFDFSVPPKEDSLDNWKHPGYGTPVLAVADATVLTVMDGIPDNAAHDVFAAIPLPMEKMFGNRVTLDLGSSRYASYGHLQSGLRVKAGDKVHAGQVLGLLGNSGHSNGPHLHFQITDGPDPIASEGIPFVIDSFTYEGKTITDEMPFTGWNITFPSALEKEISRLFNGALDNGVVAKDVESILDSYGVPTAVSAGQDAANDFLFVIGNTDARTVRKALRLYESAHAPGVVLLRARLTRMQAERQAAKTPSNPALRDELEAMFKSDQAKRENFDAETLAADAKRAPKLQAILDQYGVPTFDMVGRDAASHFVTMVQHQSPAMRRQALPLLKANVEKGQANASDYATEYDRSQNDQGKPQMYGENFVCGPDGQFVPLPIADAEHVDERRAEVGLEPLSTHTKMIRHVYAGANICKK
jgi:hypothetical protein